MAKQVTIDDEVMEMEKTPVLYIELYDKRPSGFIKDHEGRPAGSFGTEHYHQLDCPKAEFIPTSGFRRGVKSEIRNGKKVELAYNEPIRYIKEQTEISVERQQALNISPARASKENLIEIKGGSFTVAREGSFIGLFDYLIESFYNASNPNRSERATKLYKVIELGKEEEQLNDEDMLIGDALNIIKKFYEKTAKGYVYKEEKIDALCNLFLIYAETMPGKIRALSSFAKNEPLEFLKKATKFEQTNIAHVLHAFQLGVFVFEGSVAQYAGKEKVIMVLGDEKLTHDQKIERMSERLQSPEYSAIYQEFLLELEIKKEEKLNS